MTTAVVSVSPKTSFDEVARLLKSNGVRALPVLDPAGHVLGVARWATRSTRRPKAGGTTVALHGIVRTPTAH
jgi:CBS domain-containing protein